MQAEGHNTIEPYTSHLSRSLDGGRSWANESPPNFVGRSSAASLPPGNIDFTAPGFALRCVGCGYHGNDEPGGAFFYSLDRGHTWLGPHSFGDLNDHPELAGMEMTPRTCYVVESSSSVTALLSARPAKGDGLGVVTDKVFIGRTADYGATWTFGGWVVPLDDPYRAVMPAVCWLSATEWVVALRRREIGDHATEKSGWIDVVTTPDAGNTWSAPAGVGDTGPRNGNPPAIATLGGVIAVAYGERTNRRMVVRFSTDGGSSFGDEVILRDDYATTDRMPDLGYPRLIAQADGKFACMYYWASPELPRHHIACTVFDPPAQGKL